MLYCLSIILIIGANLIYLLAELLHIAIYLCCQLLLHRNPSLPHPITDIVVFILLNKANHLLKRAILSTLF